MVKNPTPVHPTVVDAASIFDACDVVAERVGRAKVTLDYTKLRDRLDRIRVAAGWRPATLHTAILSVDPTSEGQQRFQTMLEHAGYEPDVLHYRDSYVSVPPGRSPNEMSGKPLVSLAPRIAYVAGLLARHVDPHFLVVSHSFELYGPLTDLARRLPAGRVGIAYFGSLLDHRWKATGLMESASAGKELQFFDLDPHGRELLGVDLAGPHTRQGDARSALSRF